MELDRLKSFLRNSIGYLAVLLVSLAYIATAFITIEETHKTVAEIFADGLVAFLMGVLINRIFDMQGMMNGDRDERVLRTGKLHGEHVERVSPYMDQLEEWCEEKNRDAKRRARRQFLARHAMRYDDYFDEDGFALPFVFKETYVNRRERWHEYLRYRRYRRAVEMKLTLLSPGLLISDGGSADDPYFMGRSKAEYEKSTLKKDVLTKVMTAVLFGYYGVELIRGFSVANLIWMILQVGLFVAMGVLKMQQTFVYVTDEYRCRIVKKIDLLEMFEITMKKKEEREHGNEGA